MGAQGLVIPKDRAAGVTPIAAKVAAGAAERIPIARVTNLVRALEAVKESGGWIVGADPTAGEPVYERDLRGAICLVIGGEEKGLRPLVRRACDHLVRIPLAGKTPSLNASVAASILLYEVLRQRKGR
jgi:23S rRNA (guanosine2251-2'-O)-methyltransferase